MVVVRSNQPGWEKGYGGMVRKTGACSLVSLLSLWDSSLRKGQEQGGLALNDWGLALSCPPWHAYRTLKQDSKMLGKVLGKWNGETDTR